MSLTKGSIQEYSVSELSGAIKKLIEDEFARVRVRGEITELKIASSGHAYLSLKDDQGKISAIIWRSQFSRLRVAPENGMEVIATGRVSTYGERSSYQLLIDNIEFAGEGALLARIEKLRQKCLAEGLFDIDRKKPIPFLPKLVGVITSPTGAVLHDIQTTISRRMPRDIVLWPVPVQGADAAVKIAQAIRGMSKISPRPDVIIVARGGGSLEDLMAFNEEVVVRAVVECPIPLISAVGHETDTTLIDYASDRRAPTPTAAAEMAVPLKSEITSDLLHQEARLTQSVGRLFHNARLELQACSAALPNITSVLDTLKMKLSDREERLSGAMERYMERAQFNLQQREVRRPLLDNLIRVKKEHLESSVRHLQALGPQEVLDRGFVLVETATDKLVPTSASLPKHSEITLVFADGKRTAVTDVDKSKF